MNNFPPRPPPANERQGLPYPRPSMPQQARAGPQRQPNSRPTIDQQPSALQRRPDPRYPEQQPVLQRQPSRPDQPYQEQPRRLQQPQPSRPDQYYQAQAPPLSQSMPDPYAYSGLPVQPVAPAFARAPSSPGPSESQTTLAGSRSNHMVIRGNSDDDLEKSDAFWRRFNASAIQTQLPEAERSSWLAKNSGKSSRYTRSVWIAGLLIILLAAGGIGIGIFLSLHNSSNNTRPNTLGGAADVSGTAGTPPAGVGNGVGVGGVATTSSLHVSPTNTVA